MARITSFVSLGFSDRGRRMRTNVECGYSTIDVDGIKYLHLETYGSSDRDIPDKVSQAVELDRERASELKTILEAAFPGI